MIGRSDRKGCVNLKLKARDAPGRPLSGSSRAGHRAGSDWLNCMSGTKVVAEREKKKVYNGSL